MQIVLVHWYVVAGCEDELHKFWREHAPDPNTEGFIGETLCEVTDQDEDGTTQFINIARWRSRRDFERLYREQPIDKMAFERRLRQRRWLDPLKSNPGSGSDLNP